MSKRCKYGTRRDENGERKCAITCKRRGKKYARGMDGQCSPKDSQIIVYDLANVVPALSDEELRRRITIEFGEIGVPDAEIHRMIEDKIRKIKKLRNGNITTSREFSKRVADASTRILQKGIAKVKATHTALPWGFEDKSPELSNEQKSERSSKQKSAFGYKGEDLATAVAYKGDDRVLMPPPDALPKRRESSSDPFTIRPRKKNGQKSTKKWLQFDSSDMKSDGSDYGKSPRNWAQVVDRRLDAQSPLLFQNRPKAEGEVSEEHFSADGLARSPPKTKKCDPPNILYTRKKKQVCAAKCADGERVQWKKNEKNKWVPGCVPAETADEPAKTEAPAEPAKQAKPAEPAKQAKPDEPANQVKQAEPAPLLRNEELESQIDPSIKKHEYLHVHDNIIYKQEKQIGKKTKSILTKAVVLGFKKQKRNKLLYYFEELPDKDAATYKTRLAAMTPPEDEVARAEWRRERLKYLIANYDQPQPNIATLSIYNYIRTVPAEEHHEIAEEYLKVAPIEADNRLAFLVSIKPFDEIYALIGNDKVMKWVKATDVEPDLDEEEDEIEIGLESIVNLKSDSDNIGEVIDISQDFTTATVEFSDGTKEVNMTDLVINDEYYKNLFMYDTYAQDMKRIHSYDQASMTALAIAAFKKRWAAFFKQLNKPLSPEVLASISVAELRKRVQEEYSVLDKYIKGRGSVMSPECALKVIKTMNTMAPTGQEWNIMIPEKKDAVKVLHKELGLIKMNSYYWMKNKDKILNNPQPAGQLAAPLDAGQLAAPLDAGQLAAPLDAGQLAAPAVYLAPKQLPAGEPRADGKKRVSLFFGK